MVQRDIHIAVIGGGVGGATLALALSRIPRISFTVYEAGSQFKEQGQAVGLSRNAANAMRLLGVDWDQLCQDVGAAPVKTSRLLIGAGPHAGKHAFDLGGQGDQFIFSRPLLMDWIVRSTTSMNIETNKKLSSIEEQFDIQEVDQRPLKLCFEDGTTATADAVIGCDGIHSKTRRSVLGDNHPAVNPVYGGAWNCTKTVTYEEARRCIDEGFMDPASHLDAGWCGYGGYLMFLAHENNTMVSLIGCGSSDKFANSEKWRESIPSEQLKSYFNTSHQNLQGLIDCMFQDAEMKLWSSWESAVAPTYCNKNICLIGDAAHASTPWMSTGAGMTIEDVLVLSKLLQRVSSPSDVTKAFEAYDHTVRPRTQYIVQKSRQIGEILMGQNSDFDLDPQKIAEGLPPLYDYVREVDLETYVGQALA